MSNSQLLFLLFFLCLYTNIFCNESLNAKSRHNIFKDINTTHNEFRRKNKKKIFSKRKLDNLNFWDLNIYIDYGEFERTFPPEFSDIKGRFISAMERAKSILEDYLQILTDKDGSMVIGSSNSNGVQVKYIETLYEIYGHSDIFDETHLFFNEYNYFIFAKFTTELNQESASLILSETLFDTPAPYLGIILFNKKSEYLQSAQKSKFTQGYLNNLMLHHFIRLLGFNEFLADTVGSHYIPNVDNVIYLDVDNSLNSFTNTLNYAKEYFGCTSINRINLYINEDNTDTYVLEPTNRLYLPKPIFSGEILTKFNDLENPTLSGFTLAFLDDLPYLKVKKEYAGDLTRFGEYAGCSCRCDNFISNVNEFWDCSVCRGGYFMAMESIESETHCETDDKKDYYFLYNSESNIYKKCELEIQNCQKCDSKTKCTSCRKGYKLKDEDGKTICKEEGLSTGAIIGIVFGCVGFLAIIVLIIICILKKRNEQKGEEIKEKEEITEKKEGDTGPQNAKEGQEDNLEVINI